jgi:ubiquinone/menaquinone biosynthesis C-methylase UbiE
MEIYDAVAKEYSDVFDDISLRCLEWPWLKKQIDRNKPQSLLDAGCGNGYLSQALIEMVPNLFAIEPSGEMFLLAKKQLGNDVNLLQAPAENLPFQNESFDMIISFLSFRYMQWDKSLAEIQRTLKPKGVFILIDLFAASFHPRYFHKYIKTFFMTRMQYMKHKEYRRKLFLLTQNKDWKDLIDKHPKRNFLDAKQHIEKHFCIKEQKILSMGLRGKTTALVCTNDAST